MVDPKNTSPDKSPDNSFDFVRLPKWEFVPMMAMMSALMALSIDTVLPALPTIGLDLNVSSANNTQLIISFLFIGFGIGLLVFGPLSDSIGRKKPIYFGGTIFCLGCLVSIFSKDLEMMLIGRLLQGFGAAGPRIVSIALIRDEYEGRAMAKIMSLIMTVFILVPAIAPSFGQVILMFAPWPMLFTVFLILAFSTMIWFGLRQPETLPKTKRKPYSLNIILFGAAQTCRNRVSLSATIVSGLVFGALIGYLSSAQQIFADIYDAADMFPIYFGMLALAIGTSSFANSKLLNIFGMKGLIRTALLIMMTLSIPFATYLVVFNQTPQLWLFLLYLGGSFACIGMLFGNLNAVALEPMGHIAGIASAVIGSLQNIISVAIGIIIGQMYDGTVIPLILGFALLSTSAFVWMHFGLKNAADL
jgi:MFS transporter, DHA1 family, multidrug resistance protein